ncbi:MAG: c-type cytochrome [candidate division NC10 bacterium]|nr:c-type cytochrome [candidate division NC10 bacterium]
MHAQADAPSSGTNPFAGDAQAARQGERLFKSFCGPCHGYDAKGGQGPDLTDEVWAHGGSDQEIFRTIHDGVPGTRMREFGSVLTDEELWKLVTFIRSRAGKPR